MWSANFRKRAKNGNARLGFYAALVTATVNTPDRNWTAAATKFPSLRNVAAAARRREGKMGTACSERSESIDRSEHMCELHIFAIISPPGGVHIFAWPANFRNFAPKPCIFSHTTPVRCVISNKRAYIRALARFSRARDGDRDFTLTSLSSLDGRRGIKAARYGESQRAP